MMIYKRLDIGMLADKDKPAVQITSIQKVGDEKSEVHPSADIETLWLRPGKYRAKLVCNRSFKDKYNADLLKDGNGSALKKDGYFYFSIGQKTYKEFQINSNATYVAKFVDYRLNCAVSKDGESLFMSNARFEISGK